MDTTMWAGEMGLAGAIVGGLATLIVGLLAVSAQKSRDFETDRAVVHATLQAIRVEVTELTEVHMASAGGIIDAASVAAPIELLYPVSGHYFTAFEVNADKIGRIADGELRSQIIRTYVHFKARFDTVRLNSRLSEHLEHATAVHRTCVSEDESVAANEAILCWKQAAAYAALLKQANSRATQSGTELISLIDQHLEQSTSSAHRPR
ncbi:hypothetical protein C1922_10100 [Stenotrophomonas sp. ZAC14D2_NAIMI4_7]|uniref:hypothetical protein n=1 Tax=Stenotrophomonas sp. ZAC14D2_NAIMI4_7 TaxID=2072405 RepID=UPI000D53D63D|nr:hypothetical protein [Stenotrophomonas sp. ZAC14D2_NAIMI4_7]AWH17630.1 hypothetical protein C1922_10100 [Stenotrophomonas sp. ZAC14D2_NAIMI4_7]